MQRRTFLQFFTSLCSFRLLAKNTTLQSPRLVFQAMIQEKVMGIFWMDNQSLFYQKDTGVADFLTISKINKNELKTESLINIYKGVGFGLCGDMISVDVKGFLPENERVLLFDKQNLLQKHKLYVPITSLDWRYPTTKKLIAWEEPHRYGLFDVEKRIFEWLCNVNDPIFAYAEDALYLSPTKRNDQLIVSKQQFSDGKIVWTTELSKDLLQGHPSYEKFVRLGMAYIGKADGIVVFHIQNFGLIALDDKTGRFLWRLKRAIDRDFEDEILALPASNGFYQFLPEEDKILGFFGVHYLEIKLSTGDVLHIRNHKADASEFVEEYWAGRSQSSFLDDTNLVLLDNGRRLFFVYNREKVAIETFLNVPTIENSNISHWQFDGENLFFTDELNRLYHATLEWS